MREASGPYHHGDLREALVAAVLAILAEGGDPSTLSLREAARRAGVSAMAPYRHFADKEALLGAVAAVGFARLASALESADREGRDGIEALVGQGLAYVRFAAADPALFRLMFGPSVSTSGECAEAGERAFAVLADRVAGLVPPASAAGVTLHCWALVHGLAALAVDGQIEGRFGPQAAAVETALRLAASAMPTHD